MLKRCWGMEVREQLFLSENNSNEIYTLSLTLSLPIFILLGVNLISDLLLLRGYFLSVLS